MLKGTIKKLVLIVCIFIISVAGIGFYFYNKGPQDIRHSRAQAVSATDLYKAYVNDSASAKAAYGGKVLQVSGVVEKFSVNQQGASIIQIGSGVEGAFINCTLTENVPALNAKQAIQLKGVCQGIGQGDPDLGIAADIYLTQCFIVD